MEQIIAAEIQECSTNPDRFWTKAANSLHWYKKWDQLMDHVTDYPFTKWFVGGELNVCYNCVDRHVESGLGDRIGHIYESPVTNTTLRITYSQILDQVSKLAGLLSTLGVSKGDVVAIYMPSIPEGLFSFLACARIGAVHNSIPAGLPAQDLIKRIDHSQPKLLITASHGYIATGIIDYKQLVDSALKSCSHKVDKCLVLRRKGLEVAFNPKVDIDWAEAVSKAEPRGCVPVSSTDLAFIIYTSGSTGTPKAIGHAAGSFAVRWALDYKQFCVDPESSFYGTTSLGWIASHMVLVYGPLLNGHVSVFFEGDHLLMSDPRAMYRLLDKHNVKSALIRPGVLRAIKSMDPQCKIAAEFNLELATLITGGEFVDAPMVSWGSKAFRTTVTNVWAQTELAGIMSGVCRKYTEQEKQQGYAMEGIATPGVELVCLDQDMKMAEPGQIGRLVAKLPLPPGGFATLYKDHRRAIETYFDPYPGYFDSKDEGYITKDGKIKMVRRADEMIKAGPIYVSATSIEQVISEHASIREVAVLSQPHNAFREIPVAFLILNSSDSDRVRIASEIVDKVRNHFGTSMPFDSAIVVDDLPRSRTGKIHKPSLNSILRRIEPEIGSVENPEVFGDILLNLRADNVI